MLGVLITLAVVAGCAGVGAGLFRRWTEGLDPALRLGTEGLLGLGVLGTLTLFIGLIPGGLGWGVYVAGAYALAGLAFLAMKGKDLRFSIPRGPSAIGVLLLGVLSLFTLVAVLAPSTADDWDTLAYHLAVPKLWLAEGRIFSVPFISHSNFPDVIDDLYAWGLTWGSQQGAKAFSLGFFLLGIIAIFGFARQRYGNNAGWWGATAFATVPAILWESGTAYIDVGHGLFAGLGIAFAASAAHTEENRRSNLIVSGLLLGFAAASKYTGVEALLIAAFLVFAYGFKAKSGLKASLTVLILGGVIAAPWYIKNVVNVGNPVYPFMYERFGGANWDQRRADAYKGEQATFGVAQTEKGKNPAQIGHSVLGLGYQPGRYVNPGQTTGGGSPMGAVGIAILAALVLWAASGRSRRFEGFILASAGLTLFGWFFLSQQSRYIVALAPPAAILLGGAVYALKGASKVEEDDHRNVKIGVLGYSAMGATILQSLYTLWLFQTANFTNQSQVAFGRISADEYQSKTIPFYNASKTINETVKGGKVALYDEVFGYLLDVPYFWANPGHTTTIPYDSMQNADDYVREMKKLGFTHVYINPGLKDPTYAAQWIASMGINGPAVPLPADTRKGHFDDWMTKWEILIADAAATGKLIPEAAIGRKILFRIP